MEEHKENVYVYNFIHLLDPQNTFDALWGSWLHWMDMSKFKFTEKVKFSRGEALSEFCCLCYLYEWEMSDCRNNNLFKCPLIYYYEGEELRCDGPEGSWTKFVFREWCPEEMANVIASKALKLFNMDGTPKEEYKNKIYLKDKQ